MERGDWEAFFPHLAPNDLKRLAGIGVGCAVTDDPAFRALCLEHGVSTEALDLLQGTARQMLESANAMARDDGSSPEAMMERSLAHRDLVKAHDAALDGCARQVRDRAAFVAAVERLRRATSGGGSVSSSLFVGETLSDITTAGNKAVGVRRYRNGETEPVAFVRTRDGWHVSIFARPRL